MIAAQSPTSEHGLLFVTPDELKVWMRVNGYTYRGLADALGVSLSTVVRWRQGANEIPRTAELAMRYLASKPDQSAGR